MCRCILTLYDVSNHHQTLSEPSATGDERYHLGSNPTVRGEEVACVQGRVRMGLALREQKGEI